MENMPKEMLRKIVKEKVLEATFIYLKEKQKSHSKMDMLRYDNFEMSSYLKSPYFNNESASLLLALRTRTVRGIRNDFGGLYQDKMCPLGCGALDTLQNILSCNVIQQHHTSQDITEGDIKYEDVFSSDIRKQKQAVELYKQLLEIRNNIINSPPVATTGPVHSA